MPRPLRVAIACTGIGRVKRGFERYFADLHRVLKGEVDITLFKGGGKSQADEKRIRCASRIGRLSRILPVHRLMRRTSYHTECLTFALGLYPRVRLGGFDVVHCIDPPLARIMFKIRRVFGGDFRLLYTEGCAMLPEDYPPADHAHHVAMQAYSDALAHGYSTEHMSLTPCGVDPSRFLVDKSGSQLRREHGIPEEKFVILSVAAIDRRQKRIDYLIDEVARLEGDVLLWLDGSFDQGDPKLLDYGKERLGDAIRFSHVPSNRVGELYKMADVMVLASVHESFALSVAEAVMAGVPVFVHDSPHFKWLVEEDAYLLDMRKPGTLAKRLTQMMTRTMISAERIVELAARTRERFDWNSVRHHYANLYQRVSSLPKLDSNRNARGEFFYLSAPSAPCQESS